MSQQKSGCVAALGAGVVGLSCYVIAFMISPVLFLFLLLLSIIGVLLLITMV